MPNLRPRGQRVLVQETDSYTLETKSGIVIQRFEPTKTRSGTVLAIGENCPDLVVGDTVHYRRECGTPLEDGQVLLNYDDIEGVGGAEVLSL